VTSAAGYRNRKYREIKSPVLANSLLGLFQNVHGGSFTEAEIRVLLLTNAVTNSSSWAVAFHIAEGLVRNATAQL
jgi:hypothetical protein